MALPAPSNDQSGALVEISLIINELTGVQLGANQKAMVESRLQKRILELKLGSIDQYLVYFKNNRTTEQPHLVALLTTHHTYFFREFCHFEFISDVWLPKVIPIARARSDKTLRIWSAASSRGQEAYSLAMYLHVHLKTMAPELKFEIVGSDVDAESVKIAQNGVYAYDEVKEIPAIYAKDNWARGTGDIANYVKAKPSLKNVTKFEVQNLQKLGDIGLKNKFDLIFCRNVFIYFTPAQIQNITAELTKRMEKHGSLVLGLSESLHGIKNDLKSRGKSIYEYPQAPKAELKLVKTPAAVSLPDIVKVFCIDDSSTILALLKKTLTKEHGFEVVGTAINGLDASEKLKTTKPDVITLDIHMEQQNGIEYLERNFNKQHPPVVMVTSVAKENSDLALKALSLGASDYVEKPALQNLEQRADEIRTKLRCALKAKLNGQIANNIELTKEFSKKDIIKNPAKCTQLVLLSVSDFPRFSNFLKERGANGPGLCILTEGSASILGQLAAKLKATTGFNIVAKESPTGLPKPNEIWLGDLAQFTPSLKGRNTKCSLAIFGEVSYFGAAQVLEFNPDHLLAESKDGKGNSRLSGKFADLQPATSFAYLMNQYFSKQE